MKVLIAALHPLLDLWSAPVWAGERLQAEFSQLRVVQLPDYKRLSVEIRDAEVYVGFSLRPEQVVSAAKLRWIHSTASAVHQLMSPELVASNVVLTNVRDVHGAVVAEHALALIFALAKQLPLAFRHQARRHWSQQDLWNARPHSFEIAGTTLLVIGLGGIGRELAWRAAALGMHVIAVREHPERGSETAHEVFGLKDLDAVLDRARYVVLAAPVTQQTQELFNADRLARMRPDAYLINISRGQLVNEEALIEALRERRIAGAALNVLTEEPLPADSPFWDLDNVLITPHSASFTEKLWERQYALLAGNMRRFLAGQPLLNVVDKVKGY